MEGANMFASKAVARCVQQGVDGESWEERLFGKEGKGFTLGRYTDENAPDDEATEMHQIEDSDAPLIIKMLTGDN